jgi:hypothetical protein
MMVRNAQIVRVNWLSKKVAKNVTLVDIVFVDDI